MLHFSRCQKTIRKWRSQLCPVLPVQFRPRLLPHQNPRPPSRRNRRLRKRSKPIRQAFADLPSAAGSGRSRRRRTSRLACS